MGKFRRCHPVGPSRISSEIFCLKQLNWVTDISYKRPEFMFSVFKDTWCCHCDSEATESKSANRYSDVPVQFHKPKKGEWRSWARVTCCGLHTLSRELGIGIYSSNWGPERNGFGSSHEPHPSQVERGRGTGILFWRIWNLIHIPSKGPAQQCPQAAGRSKYCPSWWHLKGFPQIVNWTSGLTIGNWKNIVGN